MRIRTLRTVIVVLLFATTAVAQTKFSGTVQCAKPDQQLVLEIGDRPNHSFMITQATKCTWTKPFEMAGSQAKEDAVTVFDEISSNKTRAHGYVVTTLASGDKLYFRIQGSNTMKDGKFESGVGTATILGGTGKLKGIKGKDTYKGQASGEGWIVDVEGEYEVPK